MTFNKFLLALILVVAAARPAFAQIATEIEASVGYCEGCDNGNVVLTLNGISEASVFGLTFDADAGHWVGTGKVEYVGQGLSINDAAASFQVDLVDSPTGAVGSPTFNPNCARASKLASSIRVLGSKAAGSYVIQTSNFQIIMGTPCASASMDVSIDASPGALGKIKKTYRTNTKGVSLGSVKGGYRTVGGRIVTF